MRAGSGLLVSAHGRPGSQSSTRALDSREPQHQIEQSQQLLHTLAESAHKHKAKIAGPVAEPDVVGAKKTDKARQLPNERAMYTTVDSLAASDTRGTQSQANYATAVKGGLVFFTYGKAQNAQKPNAETGIAMHAASGNVNTQSQSAATRLTADKSIEVSSSSAMVKIAAPKHILLTAAGAAIDMQPGSITLKGPGMIEFKASAKELTGAGNANASRELKSAELKDCPWLAK